MDSYATFETAEFGARFTANKVYADKKKSMEEFNSVFIHSGSKCSYFYAEVNSQNMPKLQESVQQQITRIVENPKDWLAIQDFLTIYGTHIVR